MKFSPNELTRKGYDRDVRCWIEIQRPRFVMDEQLGYQNYPLDGFTRKLIFPAPYQPAKGKKPSWESLAYYNTNIIGDYMTCSYWSISGYFISGRYFIENNFSVDSTPSIIPGFECIPLWFKLSIGEMAFHFPAPHQPIKGMNDTIDGIRMLNERKHESQYKRTFGCDNFSSYSNPSVVVHESPYFDYGW